MPGSRGSGGGSARSGGRTPGSGAMGTGSRGARCASAGQHDGIRISRGKSGSRGIGNATAAGPDSFGGCGGAGTGAPAGGLGSRGMIGGIGSQSDPDASGLCRARHAMATNTAATTSAAMPITSSVHRIHAYGQIVPMITSAMPAPNGIGAYAGRRRAVLDMEHLSSAWCARN